MYIAVPFVPWGGEGGWGVGVEGWTMHALSPSCFIEPCQHVADMMTGHALPVYCIFQVAVYTLSTPLG